ITWGMFKVPESEVGVLGDVAGLDVLDLGCGVAYFSAWLARRRARVVGLDVTPAQRETARRMQAETGLEFGSLEASAESVPLVERQGRAEAADHRYYDFVPAGWGRRWPAEEIWVARKR